MGTAPAPPLVADDPPVARDPPAVAVPPLAEAVVPPLADVPPVAETVVPPLADVPPDWRLPPVATVEVPPLLLPPLPLLLLLLPLLPPLLLPPVLLPPVLLLPPLLLPPPLLLVAAVAPPVPAGVVALLLEHAARQQSIAAMKLRFASFGVLARFVCMGTCLSVGRQIPSALLSSGKVCRGKRGDDSERQKSS